MHVGFDRVSIGVQELEGLKCDYHTRVASNAVWCSSAGPTAVTSAIDR